MQSNTSKTNGQSLKSTGSATSPDTIASPTIALPKGGGAIKGIDEQFSVDAARGTAAFSISLPFSKARNETPAISLSYNSGFGNGVFGLGWQLGMPSIRRKTDHAIPKYMDSIDSDTFLFSEKGDLVPAFKKQADGNFELDAYNNYVVDERESADQQTSIRYYKPRIEGAFSRIERWLKKKSGIIKWKVTTKDNFTTLYGWTENARISNPGDDTKIFEWLPEYSFDDKGNCIHYLYRKENDLGLDTTATHNRNRIRDGKITFTNTYLSKILYGNKDPYYFGDPYLKESNFLFSTIFDYGEKYSAASPETIDKWDFRPDPFSDYKSGFEIRTTRLCKRILFFHHFKHYDGLVRSINFGLSTNKEEDFTFLRSITQYGYIKKRNGTYTSKKLPPLEFCYQEPEWNNEIKAIERSQSGHAPFGLNQQEFQFIDLYNEGLNGILTEQSNSWYYNQNLGGGQFAPAKLIASKPSLEGLGSILHLVDLNADGRKQLVSFNSQESGYFELIADDEWLHFKAFESFPNINFRDNKVRLIDLDGDNRPEVVFAEEDAFTWYPSDGRTGFKQAQKSRKFFDEEVGPAIDFDMKEQSTFFADMSGDGLTDIVKIRNGEVCYWPNLGNGQFGAKIAMDNAPLFDNPESFNPDFLKLADIDGSGTTDLIYLGKNKFSCWKNLCGNRFSTTPFEIEAFPDIHKATKVTVADILGNGVPCILWANPFAKDANTSFKYIDMMGSKKPHVLVSFKNNLGKSISLEYKASTHYYLEDKKRGHPWKTNLFFPVHCIAKTITEDQISGVQYVSEYKYHHGYYDHSEREFRGFGMVEQTDAESFQHWEKGHNDHIVENVLHQEPVVTKTWFHTGAFQDSERRVSKQKEDFWFAEMERQGFEVSNQEAALTAAQLVGRPGGPSRSHGPLSAREWQEALRACKGRQLRTEIFAFDAMKFGNTPTARKQELTPFMVTDQNYKIELVQPKGKNKHAVFLVREGELFNYNYERKADDPRISHKINVQTDEYGNVLAAASIVYPRKKLDAALPIEVIQDYKKTTITYEENIFTNDVISEASYRLRLKSNTKKYELIEIPKSQVYYQPTDFQDILLNSQSDEVGLPEYNQTETKGKPQRRLLEQKRYYFYSNELRSALPLHRLESLALPFETYHLAYTPELIADIFENKVSDELLTEGQFIHMEGDQNWWGRSGSAQYTGQNESVEHAQKRFYQPIGYLHPSGASTKLEYHEDHFLLVEKTEDVLGNTWTVEKFNLRSLAPQRMRDLNGNLSEVLIDELGFVKAHAVFGKGKQADDLDGLETYTDDEEATLIQAFFQSQDSIQLAALGHQLLQHSTSRFLYDVDSFSKYGRPAVVSTIKRENHFRQINGQINPKSKIQIAFEYSNGSGEVIMKKAQAKPGKARQVRLHDDDSITVDEIDTSLSTPKQLRWLSSGRIIKNNKDKVVKRYEPYYSVLHHFENNKELVEIGVTPKLFYDPLGRLISTLNPDGTYSKVSFDAWKQVAYDENDSLADSSWYQDRTLRLIDNQLQLEGKNPEKEQEAAEKALQHANTPTVFHLDTLGRPILSIEHNIDRSASKAIYHHTKLQYDIAGNVRCVTDARGNTVMEYKYDMQGNKVYQKSMDAGQRWLLNTASGKPLRKWDERRHEFQYFYDAANRPTISKVIGGDGPVPLDHIFDRIIYGESLLLPGRTNETDLRAMNVLGHPIRHYDTAGLIETPAYDFHGEPLSSSRRLFKNYKEVVNWVDANLLKDLEAESFTRSVEKDALGRTIKETTPDGSTISSFYKEDGRLHGKSALHAGAKTPITYIKAIDYNEKGQKERVLLGNDVCTRFYYDDKTFRLIRIKSQRQNGGILRDWRYTFDPVGNITSIEDKNSSAVFFDNQKVTATLEYTYDALYRLEEAKGRENIGLTNFGSCDNWQDQAFLHEFKNGDPLFVQNYVQSYRYDAVGNLLEMKHRSAGNNWTRRYEYEEDNNRLNSICIGKRDRPANYTNYRHHAQHGYLLELPHLEKIGWNFKEQVVLTCRQRCSNNNTPVITYYQYDGNGHRLRKITETPSAAGKSAVKKEERIYMDEYEIYKKHTGPHAGLERVGLSLMDEDDRCVMIETRNDVNDGTEKQLVRYQLHNHLGSTSIELDGTPQANIISLEEYHPYGTSAYRAKNKNIKSAAKRYRQTGMERDEETGLQYHSNRYYLPWLGRWLSPDPLFSEIQGKSSGYKGENNSPSKIDGTENQTGQSNKPPDGKPSEKGQPGDQDDEEKGQSVLKSPLPTASPPEGETSSPKHEGLLILENINLYSYCHQNPIVYNDPTGLVPIFQAWLNGYNNAGSTGAKVGFGFLFIFAWLAHVIVNLIMLALSVTLLNPLGLFGAWDFTYGGLQSVIGLLFGTVMVLLGGSVLPYKGMGAKITLPTYFSGSYDWGISLGPVITGTSGFNHWSHEFGHTWQSRVLGPLYLFIIGIPSIISAGTNTPSGHSSFYTERWADAWAF